MCYIYIFDKRDFDSQIKGKARISKEWLVCLAVILVLTLFSWSLIQGPWLIFPAKEARNLQESLRQARELAEKENRHVKVELVCPNEDGKKCFLLVNTAVEDQSKIVGWGTAGKEELNWSPSTAVTKSVGGSQWQETFEEQSSGFWVIFSPDSTVVSEPKPFDITIYRRKEKMGPKLQGWRLLVNPKNGNIDLVKATGASRGYTM